MTVQSEVSRVSYVGNGAQTVFDVPFYFLANADLTVITAVSGVETVRVLGTDYTVAGAGVEAGGTITFISGAPASGMTVAILRQPGIVQLTDYNDQDPFPADSHERALDKLTMIAQRHAEELSRALVRARTSSPIPEGNFWKQGADGTPVDGGSSADIENAQGYAVEAKDARDLSQAWATGTNPDGLGSLSAREEADRAEVAKSAAEAAVPNVFPETITDLKAVDTTVNEVAYLKQAGREGQFIWRTGDFSAAVAADTAEGIYVAPNSDPTGASGAWVRQDADQVRIKNYGAVPADISSASMNASALRFAFDRAIEDGQAVIEIPAKTWYMDSKVTKTLSNGMITLKGAGRDATVLRWEGADGGIDLTYPEGGWWFSNPGAACNFEGLTFATSVSGGGTAIAINGQTLEGRPMPSTTFTNVGWRGANSAAYWDNGVNLLDTSITSFSDVWGVGSVANSSLGTHVRIASSADNRDSVEHTFVNFHATYGAVGIRASDHVEGIHLSNALIVGVENGIYWDCLATYESQLTIGQSHINARSRCIFMRRVKDSQIADGNLFFIQGSGTAIELRECGNTVISPQVISGQSGGGGTAIVISDDLGNLASSKTYIARQILSNFATGIWLTSTAKNVTVDPPLTNSVSTPVLDQGTNNRVILEQGRSYHESVVKTLTGGAPTETVNFALPTGRFSEKPRVVEVSGQSERIAGNYDYTHASSTATNAVVVVSKLDGTNLPAGSVRFQVSAYQ